MSPPDTNLVFDSFAGNGKSIDYLRSNPINFQVEKMGTNVLRALINLAKSPKNDILPVYRSSIRINAVGDALEYFIKDLLCDSSDITSLHGKEDTYSKYFSYLGNQNNPPDIIIRGGPAIEIKKIEGIGSSIALNSSYPKSRLYSDDRLITEHCRKCERWSEKDHIYCIGVIDRKTNKLRVLWIVYGDCYAADKETYERVRDRITGSLESLQGVETEETNELGRVNKVDPLGITYLRVRGMWGIKNPINVFDYVVNHEKNDALRVYLISKKKTFEEFPPQDKGELYEFGGDSLSVKDVKVKNPNNPAKYMDAKLVELCYPAL